MPSNDGFAGVDAPSNPSTDDGLGDRIRVSDLSNVYLDSTLVLVGCGKAKRDPNDPMDRHLAVDPSADPDEMEWPAADLYTSAYFGTKREFAHTVTGWAGNPDRGWAVLSAEHHTLPAWAPVKPYDRTISDLGDDPTNPDHHVDYPYRRPDGGEVVTELDKWTSMVAITLGKWIASYRDGPRGTVRNDANTLLVLAGQDYIEPLRERGVFEYGAARVTGNPNQFREFPLNVRFLFEEIDAGGMGEQMAWLSDAVDRLDDPADAGDQEALETWTGQERRCDECGATDQDVELSTVAGGVFCPEHAPIGRCSRCDEWTTETGLGSYPLCSDCQTDSGGQKRNPVQTVPGEQGTLEVVDDAE